jgi:TolB-like protein/DNA-binding winged helix-turn-helix (wHTH) protein/Tfp pilus assembly protein PilF
MNGLMEKEFRLGAWVVAPKLNSLSNNGKTIRLEPKVMQVLVCLAEAKDVVPKEKLMGTVWAGTFVTDDVLTRSISELRKAFEDDPKNPQYIQTIPKGGYRLLVPVENAKSKHEAAPVEPVAMTSAEVAATLPAVKTQAPLSNRSKWIPALAIACGLLFLTLFLWKRFSSASSTPPRRAMLAVLPFQNLNNDSSQDYFADGLTAEMISQLGRLPSDRLGVIAWNSMIRYKGVKKSEDEVGSALGANYILEGTVRRAGDRVRITAELVHTGERSHIWANSYEGDLSDVLALQSRVAREIASEIQLQLTPEQQARLNNPVQVNAEGYDAYLKARSVNDGKMPVDKDIQRLREAIGMTPAYAAPYVALAVSYRGQASFGLAPSKSSYASARAALEKALQLDPNLASAHREMGWVEWRGEWDFAAADKEFRRALELNPGESLTHSEYSLYLKSVGRYDEALRESNRAIELSPLDIFSHANVGTLLALMQHYDSSMEHFDKALQLDPRQQYTYERLGAVLLWQGKNEQAIEMFQKAADLTNRQPEKLAWLGYAYAISGKRNEALNVLDEIKRNPRQQYVSPFYMGLLYMGLGDKENAIRSLEKAYADHDEWMVYLNTYPEFASLHTDRRFQDLQRRVGLP